MSEIFVTDPMPESTEPTLSCLQHMDTVDAKHNASYGMEGMEKTRQAALCILRDALTQEADPVRSNNILLVGKVQSGKTSNLESLVALALDNGFNFIVIYGGSDNTLLKQSVIRFRKTFDIESDSDNIEDISDVTTPLLFTTLDTDGFYTEMLNTELLEECINNDVPIIIDSLKIPERLRQINSLIEESPEISLRAMIIDDEGDQASLNNVKDKETDASRTYEEICRMKQALGDPLYFSVTATPQANIFLDELSELRPSAIQLLYPAKGYTGADAFHINDNSALYEIEDELLDPFERKEIPESLRTALTHYIFASVVYKRRRKLKSDMVIHAHYSVERHSDIYHWVASYIQELEIALEAAVDDNDKAAQQYLEEIYLTCFDENIRKENLLDNNFLTEARRVIKDLGIILENGPGKFTRIPNKFKKHKIYIGAQLLERGITFDNLLTTYFTRWAKSGGNMDTNLQRGRWFGYRNDYFDLIKLFIPRAIAQEYTILANMEDDLWEQFSQVAEGFLSIDEIVVLAAEGTKQKPTRKAVADYSSLTTSAWLTQSCATFDQREVKNNTQHINVFCDSLTFRDASYGRPDKEINCQETVADGDFVASLFAGLAGIFDNRSFKKNEIMEQLKSTEQVAVIKMFSGRPRVRSFWDNAESCRIKALQQGRDQKSKTYLGDKAVVSKSCPVTLQIYLIAPRHQKGTGEFDNTQYMFALHRDTVRRGFRKA